MSVVAVALNHVDATRASLPAGVDFRTYTHRGAFDLCSYCQYEPVRPATCRVYSRDDGTEDTCPGCVVTAAESAVEESGGRPELVTVEMALIEVAA